MLTKEGGRVVNRPGCNSVAIAPGDLKLTSPNQAAIKALEFGADRSDKRTGSYWQPARTRSPSRLVVLISRPFIFRHVLIVILSPSLPICLGAALAFRLGDSILN